MAALYSTAVVVEIFSGDLGEPRVTAGYIRFLDELSFNLNPIDAPPYTPYIPRAGPRHHTHTTPLIHTTRTNPPREQGVRPPAPRATRIDTSTATELRSTAGAALDIYYAVYSLYIYRYILPVYSHVVSVLRSIR